MKFAVALCLLVIFSHAVAMDNDRHERAQSALFNYYKSLDKCDGLEFARAIKRLRDAQSSFLSIERELKQSNDSQKMDLAPLFDEEKQRNYALEKINNGCHAHKDKLMIVFNKYFKK